MATDHEMADGSSGGGNRPRPGPGRQACWLAGLLVLCFAAAGAGGAITATALDDWYPALAKPWWTPPDWVFGPVWTVLYALMAVSAWLVWRRAGLPAARGALLLFAAQLALNVGWSAIFFGLRRPGAAAIEIVVLWLAIAATAFVFGRRDRWAGLLLLPYLAWSTYAAALNWALWTMNA